MRTWSTDGRIESDTRYPRAQRWLWVHAPRLALLWVRVFGGAR